MASEFAKTVVQLILRIPFGKVATYGQIAELAGKPHGARGVSWILHSCSTSHQLPWHRVLNSQGKISFESETRQYRKQKSLLASEGVILDQQGKLDLRRHQWKKKKTVRKTEKKKSKKQTTFRQPTLFDS